MQRLTPGWVDSGHDESSTILADANTSWPTHLPLGFLAIEDDLICLFADDWNCKLKTEYVNGFRSVVTVALVPYGRPKTDCMGIKVMHVSDLNQAYESSRWLSSKLNGGRLKPRCASPRTHIAGTHTSVTYDSISV